MRDGMGSGTRGAVNRVVLDEVDSAACVEKVDLLL